MCLGTGRVDLVDLRRASPVLRMEILREGKPIWAVDEAAHERFVMETLRLYRDTESLRQRHREILRRRMAAWSSGAKQSRSGSRSSK